MNATFNVTEEFIDTQADGDLATVLIYSNGTSTSNGFPADQENSKLFVLRQEEADWKIAVYLFDQPNLGLCGTGEETFIPESGRSTPNGEVEQVVTDHFTALNNEDIEGSISLFTADAKVIQDDVPRAMGTDETSSTYNFLFRTGEGQLNATFDVQEGFIDTRIAGDIDTPTLFNRFSITSFFKIQPSL